MIIRKYGLLLREVEREDIEMIRQYRNSEAIKNKMIYRKHITREQQQQWFEEIRNFKHVYFLIYKEDIAVGLINGKNINHEERSSEGGIFIWKEDSNYETSVLASIILNDWNFFFNDFRLNYAQVLKSNKQAIAYNEFMGYKISERKHENPEVIWMTQTKDDYIRFRQKVIDLKLVDFNIESELTVNDLSIDESEIEYKRALIAKLPLKPQQMFQKMLNDYEKAKGQ